MKKWLSVLFIAVILCACGKAEENDSKEKSPDIEVKVKPPKEEQPQKEKKKTSKKQNKQSKQPKKDNNATASASQTTASYDTERYNMARLCLITPGKEHTADCQEIVNTAEYSKAWNNLTSEGYICQSGQCNIQKEVNTSEKVIKQKEPVTNEQESNVPIATEVIPAKPAKSTEPKPSVEPPKTTEAVDNQSLENNKSTETKSKTDTKEVSNAKVRSASQETTNANN